MSLRSAALPLLVAALVVPGPGLGQGRDGPVERWERQSGVARDLQQQITRLSIEPVVSALKRSASGDPDLLRLLDHVEFTATPHLLRPANAYAVPRRGRPGGTVEVDLGWFQQAHAVALLTGLTLLDPDGSRGLNRSAGFAHGKAVGEAIREGREPPRLRIVPEEYVTDPVELAFVRGIAMRLVDEAMAWTVLHEVAHHTRGHLQASTSSTPKWKLRAQELEADAWAFRKLSELGIPLFAIHQFMMRMEAEETLLASMGLGVPESESSHPSWSRRRAQLERAYDPMEASSSTWRAFVAHARVPGAEGRPEVIAIHYTFPRDPAAYGSCMAVMQMGPGIIQPMAVEMREGSAFLYSAPEGAQIEVRLFAPNTTVTPLQASVVELATGEKTTGLNLAYEQSFALYGDVTAAGGLPIAQITGFSPNDEFRRVLGEMNLTEQKRRRAEQAFDWIHDQTCAVWTEFSRNKIQLREMVVRNQQDSNRYAERMRSILGPAQWARLQSRMSASDVSRTGLAQVEKLLGVHPDVPAP